MVSGHLAAQNFIQKYPYQQYNSLWKKSLQDPMKTALVNRYLYNFLGNRGYKRVLKSLNSQSNPHNWLYKLYKPSLGRKIIYPWARMRLKLKRSANYAKKSHCDCTWCKCVD